MALTKTEVSKLYVSIFNRASEGAGNTYWQEDAADLKDAAAKMLSTPDAATYFGTSLDSNQAFIEHIYLNTLNKTASQDTEGVAYWVNQLNSGLSRAEIVGSLVTAVDDYAASTDPVTAFAYHQVTNRVAVSDSIADSGVTDMAFTQKALAAVSADMSTLDIVENLVQMVQENPTALTEVSNTLVEVKELIAANASNATASAAVLANLATVIENVAASSTSGTISNLSSTLSALTATVEAAKTDAAFIAHPETLASSIATNPTVVTQSANTTVTTGTAVEVPTTPTTPSGGGSSGGGGSSTPAPTTQTVSVSADGSSDASSLASTYNFTAGTYEYTIAGFNDGDVIDLPTGMTPTIINTSFSDTNLTVQWAYNGDVITINLTGIPSADDGNIYGVTSFNTAFGAGSIA